MRTGFRAISRQWRIGRRRYSISATWQAGDAGRVKVGGESSRVMGVGYGFIQVGRLDLMATWSTAGPGGEPMTAQAFTPPACILGADDAPESLTMPAWLVLGSVTWEGFEPVGALYMVGATSADSAQRRAEWMTGEGCHRMQAPPATFTVLECDPLPAGVLGVTVGANLEKFGEFAGAILNDYQAPRVEPKRTARGVIVPDVPGLAWCDECQAYHLADDAAGRAMKRALVTPDSLGAELDLPPGVTLAANPSGLVH